MPLARVAQRESTRALLSPTPRRMKRAHGVPLEKLRFQAKAAKSDLAVLAPQVATTPGIAHACCAILGCPPTRKAGKRAAVVVKVALMLTLWEAVRAHLVLPENFPFESTNQSLIYQVQRRVSHVFLVLIATHSVRNHALYVM